MEKCRICLMYKRNLCSVYESEQGVSYSHMITSIAKIKIIDVYKNKICLPCRRKLRSLYDFKELIERSDSKINQNIGILKFDNIHELKSELLKKIGNNMEIMNNCEDIIVNFTSLFHRGCDTICYKNITVKKVTPFEYRTEIGNRTVPILNLSNITKLEAVNDYDDMSNNINQYKEKICLKPKNIKRRKEGKKKGHERGINHRTNKLQTKFKGICITPVVLDDIRVIRTNYKPDKSQRKHECRRSRRQNMCPYCGMMSTNIKSHIMVHIGVRKYKCSECNKGFFTKRQLNVHQIKHITSGIFKCDHCVAVFNNKISLQSHMVMHTDEKNHVCSVCSKSFKRKSALLRHKLIHNSSAKSFKCDLCNMSFLYKQGLRNHMRVHTGERPYKCEICVQPYSYKNDFNRHCLKKHGVFLKRRSVYVMNEEVLMQERKLIKGLMRRLQGIVQEGEPLNPFRGPQAALAFEQTIKSLNSGQIPVDVIL